MTSSTSIPTYSIFNLLSLVSPFLSPSDPFLSPSSVSNLHTSSSLDSPRRFLFLLPPPICYLDCDTLILSPSINLLVSLAWTDTENVECHAVGNFRNKRKDFSGTDGNFNAGVTVFTRPLECNFSGLYREAVEVITARKWDDTEEKMLNVMFEKRWKNLEIKFNLQKRCFWNNWTRWNEVVRGGVVVVHYVGGKPWWEREEVRIGYGKDMWK